MYHFCLLNQLILFHQWAFFQHMFDKRNINRILHGWGWKTGLFNPKDSGTQVKRGLQTPPGPSIGQTSLPPSPMLDSFSCLYHPKCTYGEKSSKLWETLQCFDDVWRQCWWHWLGMQRFPCLACLLMLKRAKMRVSLISNSCVQIR